MAFVTLSYKIRGALEEGSYLSDSQQGMRYLHSEAERCQENGDQVLKGTVWPKDCLGAETAVVDYKGHRG